MCKLCTFIHVVCDFLKEVEMSMDDVRNWYLLWPDVVF